MPLNTEWSAIPGYTLSVRARSQPTTMPKNGEDGEPDQEAVRQAEEHTRWRRSRASRRTA